GGGSASSSITSPPSSTKHPPSRRGIQARVLQQRVAGELAWSRRACPRHGPVRALVRPLTDNVRCELDWVTPDAVHLSPNTRRELTRPVCGGAADRRSGDAARRRFGVLRGNRLLGLDVLLVVQLPLRAREVLQVGDV